MVAAVGAGVADVEVGGCVAYAGVGGPFYESTGAYAEERNVPAACLIRLPREVSDRQGAALLVKGLTASTIINHVSRPRPGQAILIHAAASGVALVLCQWCKPVGATVIGTGGSPEKARVAAAHGCDHAMLYRDTDFVAKVRALVPTGVDAVSMASGKGHVSAVARLCAPVRHARQLRQRLGPCASDLLLRAKKGSLSVARPGFHHLVSAGPTLQSAADELFKLVAQRVIKEKISCTYALRVAAMAHRDVKRRSTIGSALLLP